MKKMTETAMVVVALPMLEGCRLPSFVMTSWKSSCVAVGSHHTAWRATSTLSPWAAAGLHGVFIMICRRFDVTPCTHLKANAVGTPCANLLSCPACDPMSATQWEGLSPTHANH